MRNENMELIIDNLFQDPEHRKALTSTQEKMLLQVTDCYNLQLQKPMLSKANLRNYLMNKYGLSRLQAYRTIDYAAAALGNVQASHKNWIRQRVEYLSEQAFIAAKAGNTKLADSLTKIAKVLSKAFATDIDDGELIDAQKYLEINKVLITSDPSSIGIEITAPKQKEIDRLKKKYVVDDAEYEEMEEDEAGLPS